MSWMWAKDRKRALFCGGNAGVPHKLNDVREYDDPWRDEMIVASFPGHMVPGRFTDSVKELWLQSYRFALETT